MMGKRLSSIALVALTATLLSSTTQASPSGDAIEPKSGSMVCFDGYPNADYTFICNQFIESHKWLEDDIRRDHIHMYRSATIHRPVTQKAVFTLISYEALYSGLYGYLVVNADGWVGSGLIDTAGHWQSCKGCWDGKIDTQQLMQFEERVSKIPLAPQAERLKQVKGKKYTVILMQQHGTIVRRDYVGDLPPDLAHFVAETTSLVKIATDKATSEMFRVTPRK